MFSKRPNILFIEQLRSKTPSKLHQLDFKLNAVFQFGR